jgi:hypothetical protein
MLTDSVLSHSPTQSSLLIAMVMDVTEAGVAIDLVGETVLAIRSSGCLLDPRIGDQAVVLLPNSPVPVILAIIDSSSCLDKPRSMSFPGGVSILVSGGELSIRAPEGMSITSGPMEVKGEMCQGIFSELKISGETLSFSGGVLSFVARRITAIGRSIERVAEWLSDRAHMSNRTIDTIDRSVSGQTHIESETVVSIQSETTLIRSQDLVKIDSDQIHIG